MKLLLKFYNEERTFSIIPLEFVTFSLNLLHMKVYYLKRKV